jgi:hypothetical protein
MDRLCVKGEYVMNRKISLFAINLVLSLIFVAVSVILKDVCGIYRWAIDQEDLKPNPLVAVVSLLIVYWILSYTLNGYLLLKHKMSSVVKWYIIAWIVFPTTFFLLIGLERSFIPPGDLDWYWLVSEAFFGFFGAFSFLLTVASIGIGFFILSKMRSLLMMNIFFGVLLLGGGGIIQSATLAPLYKGMGNIYLYVYAIPTVILFIKSFWFISYVLNKHLREKWKPTKDISTLLLVLCLLPSTLWVLWKFSYNIMFENLWR